MESFDNSVLDAFSFLTATKGFSGPKLIQDAREHSLSFDRLEDGVSVHVIRDSIPVIAVGISQPGKKFRSSTVPEVAAKLQLDVDTSGFPRSQDFMRTRQIRRCFKPGS
jgi:hypothetical protein